MAQGKDMVNVVLDRWRGHPIVCSGSSWFYSDTGGNVADWTDRDCGHCGLDNTIDGHDHCIRDLPGVVSACCGHGSEREAYVVFSRGIRLAGREALEWVREGSSVMQGE